MADAQDKRPYEKPELTVIDFAAEEVMVVGCKSSSGSGSSKQPGGGCLISACFDFGS